MELQYPLLNRIASKKRNLKQPGLPGCEMRLARESVGQSHVDGTGEATKENIIYI